MAISLIQIANIGSPPDDPTCPLKGTLFVPDPALHPGPYHCAVITQAPHFTGNGQLGSATGVAEDLAAAGYLVLGHGTRSLAPLPGQTTNGKWPQQSNDQKIAIRYMRNTGKIVTQHAFSVTNFVATLGGSGSGSISLVTASSGTEFDDKADAAILMSPTTDFSDRESDVPPGSPFITKTAEYAGVDQNNFTELRARSPIALDLANAKPIQHWNGDNESMPYSQLTRYKAAITLAGGVGFAKYEDHTNTGTKGVDHSFAMWNRTDNGPSIAATALAWLAARAAEFVDGGGGPPPPPQTGIVRGVSALITANAAVDPATLSNVSVDAISLRYTWANVQPTPFAYDWTYLTTELARIAVAGKQAIITIQTGEGSAFFGGKKPNWLYTLMAGGSALPLATVTSGSPTVTYGSSVFVTGMVGWRITGPGIPNNTYVGIRNSGSSIGLSSSQSSNVPVNATATTTGTAFLQLWPSNLGITDSGTYVAYDTHEIAFGVTYSWLEDNGVEYTIPVFWNPVLQVFKRALATALGIFIDSLPDEQKALISEVRLACVNATSDDWNIPVLNGEPEKPEYEINQLQRWLNPTVVPPTGNAGAGYTTQKMIDTAVTKTPADITYSDGKSQGFVFGSKTAGFSTADIGKVINIVGQGARTILSVQHNTSSGYIDTTVDVTMTTVTNQTFTVVQRRTGLFDVVMAAVGADRLGGQAIASNGPTLDKEAADLAGDADAKNYLARTIDGILQPRYPARFVEQRNSVSAKQDKAPPPAGSPWKLLYDMAQAGQPVAGQALWRVFNDPDLRMNDGTRDDHDYTGPPPIPQLTDSEILIRSGQRAAGYSMKFYEIYEVDVINLPEATQFIHELLGVEEPPPPPPPPPPLPGEIRRLLPVLFIQDVNFRDDILFSIADLVKVGVANGLPDVTKERLASWGRYINKHVRYSWQLWNWPEFTCMEERAFRPIFTGNYPNKKGDEVFYLGTPLTDDDGNLTGEVEGTGYYRKIAETPNTLPTDPASWTTFDLTTQDFFIPMAQRCRRRFGSILSAWPEDPRNDPLRIKSQNDWFVSTRGLEVASQSATVFCQYQAVPYRYGTELFVFNTNYPPGALVIFDGLASSGGGICYRAIVNTNGSADDKFWSAVPFPASLSNYVIYMTAADDSDNVSTANEWRNVALQYLAREMDAKGNEMPLERYDFARRGWPIAVIVSPISTESTAPAAGQTIDERCLTEWGDIIPI